MITKIYTLDAIDAEIAKAQPTPPAGARFVSIDTRVLATMIADLRTMTAIPNHENKQ